MKSRNLPLPFTETLLFWCIQIKREGTNGLVFCNRPHLLSIRGAQGLDFSSLVQQGERAESET